MSDLERKDGKFLLGFFVGGLLGALIIFFLGTKEGKKAGKILEDRSRNLLSELEDKLTEFEKKGKDLVREGEQLKEQVVEQLEERREEFTHETTKKLDTALAHIEALQEHGRETTSSLRKRLFKNIPKKSA